MKIKFSGLIFGILFFVSALLITGMITSQTVRADEHPARLVDDAGLLTSDEAEEIEDLLDETSEEKEFDIVIVTVHELSNDAETEADNFYDNNGYGYGKNKDGVLLLICMESSDYAISTCGYGQKAISENVLDDIEEQVLPMFKSGKYYKACNELADICGNAVTHARIKNTLIRIITSLLFAIVIAFAVCSAMKAQLKSVRYQAAAGSYVVENSMDLTNQSEMFLYSIVNRVAKPKDNDRNGSSHTSAAGMSHGGRSGKF